nr:hypothetical protein CFP56_04550 [Quercus suber]
MASHSAASPSRRMICSYISGRSMVIKASGVRSSSSISARCGRSVCKAVTRQYGATADQFSPYTSYRRKTAKRSSSTETNRNRVVMIEMLTSNLVGMYRVTKSVLSYLKNLHLMPKPKHMWHDPLITSRDLPVDDTQHAILTLTGLQPLVFSDESARHEHDLGNVLNIAQARRGATSSAMNRYKSLQNLPHGARLDTHELAVSCDEHT